MKKLLIALIILPFGAFAQNEQDAKAYAMTITQEDLRDHLTIIASDAMEGRETGKRGQKMAAAYIKNHFEQLGLRGPVKDAYGDGYYQRVPLYTSSPGEIYLKAGGKKFNNFETLVYFGNSNTGGEMKTSVVFAGSGSDEDLANVDVKGKAALVLIDGYMPVFRGLGEKLQKAGASSILAIPVTSAEDWESLSSQFSRFARGGRLSVDKPEKSENAGLFFVSPSIAEALFGMGTDKMKAAIEDSKAGKKSPFKKFKSAELTYSVEQNVGIVKTENVLGFLEGTDKKDEIVIVTSHYDHIGRNGKDINNGADDDGSGTVSVLEIAEAFVKAKKEGKGPRRSILFMTVTGEEKGLLGSDYYTKNPIFPLENTVVNLNIDMIGRIDPEHEGKDDYLYLVGSDRLSSELHEISEKVGETFSDIDFDYTYNDESHPDRIYYRSDHWNFAKNNVPIIFYFSGIHEDYHKPTDTVDKIEFDQLEKRAHLIFYTAWVLSNREDRIMVDQVKDAAVETK